ncbi:uncharacterized protein LOC120114433 [Hibiscus syriacus]|uniref:uncharacterized protein LOC120114433 n=1 Tax=Hibiscus syriacus TaxID=106335 RepID=UPI0019206855|nr:uncharacterized protein LOC120114433 [Hibiscus syriacus]
MKVEASFSSISPPVFDGENYQMWAVRMETYLEALDLWEAVEEDYIVLEIPVNPTLAQIKAHKEKKMKKLRQNPIFYCSFSHHFYPNYVSKVNKGDMLQKMKETETVKEYAERFLSITNRFRLLGSSLADLRIVEKILIALPEKFEATVTTLDNTKDLFNIPLAELLSALQAQEQRRTMRQE